MPWLTDYGAEVLRLVLVCLGLLAVLWLAIFVLETPPGVKPYVEVVK